MERGTFLTAENIGLPFNSDANDYMYAIDDFNGVGYFATDRRQPEGKVCIYTFIPNQTRVTYSTDEFDMETIRSRARIERIADTWTDEDLRNEALGRLRDVQTTPVKKKETTMAFAIDDNTVYTSPDDFRVAENKERYKRLCDLQKRYREQGVELDKMRAYYHKAGDAEKTTLRGDLQTYEQQYYQLETEIHRLEKMIRNTEISNLK